MNHLSLVTEKHKRILKNITKVAAYTAMTGGAYYLAKGALGLLLKQLETKSRPGMHARDSDASGTPDPSHDLLKNSKTRPAAS
ncbi:MAG: hypothetical protein U0V70_17850 [Terriglobia bacterium]